MKNEITLQISKDKNIQFDYSFLQKMINRLIFGNYRYGKPKGKTTRQGDKHDWISRAHKELKQYMSTGNIEHLINIANYAWLEQMNPEHTNAHFNKESQSATRKWTCRL